MTDNVLPTCTLIARCLPVLTAVCTKHVVSHWDNSSFAKPALLRLLRLGRRQARAVSLFYSQLLTRFPNS